MMVRGEHAATKFSQTLDMISSHARYYLDKSAKIP